MQYDDAGQVRFAKTMTLEFESGAWCGVDLTQVPMSGDQRDIVHKLIGRAGGAPLVGDGTNCDDNGRACPALEYLERDEFEKIRDLRARLGTGDVGPAAAVIVNFCLDAIII